MVSYLKNFRKTIPFGTCLANSRANPVYFHPNQTELAVTVFHILNCLFFINRTHINYTEKTFFATNLDNYSKIYLPYHKDGRKFGPCLFYDNMLFPVSNLRYLFGSSILTSSRIKLHLMFEKKDKIVQNWQFQQFCKIIKKLKLRTSSFRTIIISSSRKPVRRKL